MLSEQEIVPFIQANDPINSMVKDPSRNYTSNSYFILWIDSKQYFWLYWVHQPYEMVSRSRHDDVQWGASYLTFLGQKIYEVSSALHNGVKADVKSHLASLRHLLSYSLCTGVKIWVKKTVTINSSDTVLWIVSVFMNQTLVHIWVQL